MRVVGPSAEAESQPENRDQVRIQENDATPNPPASARVTRGNLEHLLSARVESRSLRTRRRYA